jgi:hypothetical protein
MGSVRGSAHNGRAKHTIGLDIRMRFTHSCVLRVAVCEHNMGCDVVEHIVDVIPQPAAAVVIQAPVHGWI